MAYQGATAASSVSNPPVNLVAAISGGGFTTSPNTSINLGSTQIGSTAFNSVPGRALGAGLWWYASTDSSTVVMGSNTYFTDGFYLGMKPGDVVLGVFSSSQGSSAVFYSGVINQVSTAGAGCGSTGSYVSSTR